MSLRLYIPPLSAGSGALVSALIVSLTACSSDDGAFEARETPPPLTRKVFCAKTACDIERDACWELVESCEDTCIGGSIDNFTLCYESCRSIDCSSCIGIDSPCVLTGYRFSVTGDADAALEAACERAVARDVRCGERLVNPNCTHSAKLECSDAESAYRCHSGMACGTDTRSCLDALPATQLGTGLCARLDTACATDLCKPEVVSAIDELSRWLRDPVLDEAVGCLREPCEDVEACFLAWLDAVAG